jgi:hypothetical protein
MPRKSKTIDVVCVQSSIDAFVPLQTYKLERTRTKYGIVLSLTHGYYNVGLWLGEWTYGDNTRFIEAPQH